MTEKCIKDIRAFDDKQIWQIQNAICLGIITIQMERMEFHYCAKSIDLNGALLTIFPILLFNEHPTTGESDFKGISFHFAFKIWKHIYGEVQKIADVKPNCKTHAFSMSLSLDKRPQEFHRIVL